MYRFLRRSLYEFCGGIVPSEGLFRAHTGISSLYLTLNPLHTSALRIGFGFSCQAGGSASRICGLGFRIYRVYVEFIRALVLVYGRVLCGFELLSSCLLEALARHLCNSAGARLRRNWIPIFPDLGPKTLNPKKLQALPSCPGPKNPDSQTEAPA